MPPLLVPALISLGVGSAVAPFLAGLIFAGLSIALSILFKPDVPKPDAGRIAFKQSVPTRCRIIGQRRSAGAFMLYHVVSGGNFLGVQAICEGPANKFVKFWFHDDEISFSDEFGQGRISSLGHGQYGDGKCRVWSRLGVNPETAYDAAIRSGSPWTIYHRGDGICSVLLDVSDPGADDQAKRFPFGLPNLSCVVDATQVFDPRDENQDWADKSTWLGDGNENPILQTMWFLTASIEEGGMGLEIEEAFVPVLDEVGLQADICDANVIKKNGNSERRYTSAVMYYFNNSPSEVLAAILGTCDGFCAERGDGTFVLKAGQWDDDDFSVVITDHHIISLNVRRFRPDEDEVTGVIVKYNSIPHDHTEIDAPVWPRDAYQGGEDQRIRTIEINYCNSGTQAQRLSKRVALYEMAPISGTAVLSMYGILLLDKRGATIQCSDDVALEDCKVRLTRVEPNLVNGTVEIDFTVFDPDVCDAWDPATEEGKLQPPVGHENDTDQPLGSSTPTDLVAISSQISGTVIVDVSFDPGDWVNEFTEFNYQWRVADIGGGEPGGWTTGKFSASAVDRSGGEHFWVVTFSGMPAARLEIQLQATQAVTSEWSVSAFNNTDQPSPGSPYGFDAHQESGDGVLLWHNPASNNVHHARVYRANTGAGFAAATDISGELSASPDSIGTFVDNSPPSGSYDYWVVAETAVDVASLPRGPETVTIP